MTLRKRQTQQKLAVSMGVSKPTMHCWIVALTIHVYCNSLKPILTEENGLARVLMAMHFRYPGYPMKYMGMHDWIHLDENWFFLALERERDGTYRGRLVALGYRFQVFTTQTILLQSLMMCPPG